MHIHSNCQISVKFNARKLYGIAYYIPYTERLDLSLAKFNRIYLQNIRYIFKRSQKRLCICMQIICVCIYVHVCVCVCVCVWLGYSCVSIMKVYAL